MTSTKMGDLKHVDCIVVDSNTVRHGGSAFRRERTCRNVGGEQWGFMCSECGGHTHGSPFHPPTEERDRLAAEISDIMEMEGGRIASLHGPVPRFCPNCGARVVEEDAR